MSASLYDVLGVNKSMSCADIKKAYLKLARTHHPDKGGNPETFKEMVHASEILSDETKRRHYDETGTTGEVPPMGGGGGFPFPFDVNLQHLFGNMFGGMGPGQGQGPGQGPIRKGKKPQPTTHTVQIRLEQYYHGHQVELNINRQSFCTGCDHTGAKTRETCRRCNGHGVVNQVVQMGPMMMHINGPCTECQEKGHKVIEVCHRCTGTGFLNEKRVLTVHIPPGSRPSETYIFPEVCSDHPGYERPGDAHIVTEIDTTDRAFTYFKRVGDAFQHLETRVSISFSESLMGTVIPIDGHPGYEDGLFIELPPGIAHLDRFVISGYGMPLLKEEGVYGDLWIHTEVRMSEEERSIWTTQGVDVVRPFLQSFVPVVEPRSGPIRAVKG